MAEPLKRREFRVLLACLRPSLKLFAKNDPMRLAGATAFFTTFALPPIILILAQLFGFFIGRGKMGRGLLENVSNVLGPDSANQVRQVIRSFRGLGDRWYVILVGCIFLFMVATTLFSVIKNSLNQVWLVGVKDRPGFLFKVATRFRSFAVILMVGLLFVVGLFLESLEATAVKYADSIIDGSGFYFQTVSGKLTSLIIVGAWFIVLFRFLADGRPCWKAAIVGGLLTALLFTLGKMLLRVLLIDSNVGGLYGPSGSIVLVLLFVFYSSFILYYGACFICVYSSQKGWPIKATEKAFLIPQDGTVH
jgi:membrane protein